MNWLTIFTVYEVLGHVVVKYIRLPTNHRYNVGLGIESP